MSSKSAVAVLVLICIALGVGYLMVNASSDHDKNSIKESRHHQEVTESGSSESQSVSRVVTSGAGGGSTSEKLASSISPEEAYAIASAMMDCDVIPQSAHQFEPISPKWDAMRVECDRLREEFSIYDLAKFSAESGNPKAQLDFSALAASAFNQDEAALNPVLIEDYKRSSLRFLEQAARNGEFEALQRMSESYESGRFSKASPVLAYAYAYAYAKHMGSPLSHKNAARLAAPLKPVEIVEAHNLASGW